MFAAFTGLASRGSGLACPAGRVTLTHQELPDQGDLLSQPERDTNYLAADGEAGPAADCAAGTPTLQGPEQGACRHHLHLSFRVWAPILSALQTAAQTTLAALRPETSGNLGYRSYRHMRPGVS